MDERFELAHGLMELSVLIEDDEEFSWGSPLLEQAIKIICPDFYERLNMEFMQEQLDYEVATSLGLDPFTGKPKKDGEQKD